VSRGFTRAREQLLEHHSIIVRLVARGEDQSDPAMPGKFAQPIQFVRMPPDLRLVTASKFLPAFRIMAEPFSQFGAGRDLFHPFIDGRIRLLYSARPKPVDQDSRAVIGRGRLIGSLEPDAIGGDPLAHRRRSSGIEIISHDALPRSLVDGIAQMVRVKVKRPDTSVRSAAQRQMECGQAPDSLQCEQHQTAASL
jgi:hypothetical protein